MKKLTGFVGVVGAVLLGFGIIAWLLVGGARTLVNVHLIAGVVLLAIWAATPGSRQMGRTGEVILGRSARFGYNALLYGAVFISLLAVANYLIQKHDKRWDLTEEGVYSLSSQTQNLLKGLKKPLRLVAFKGNDPQADDETERLFSLYRHGNSERVTTELIDPRTRPHLVQQYEMKQGNVAYIEYGEGQGKGVSRLNDLTEESITNAVIKLSRGEAKKIYYLVGHEEPSPENLQATGAGKVKAALADEHFTFETLLLSQKGSVPDDAAAVMVVSPKKPFLPGELDLLRKYADGGGRLILMADPEGPEEMADLAASYGIEIRPDIVIDKVVRLFAGPALGYEFLARSYEPHAITQNMTAEQVTVFTAASSVAPLKSVPQGGTVKELVKTSPTAWGEKNLGLIFDAEQPDAVLEPEDAAGPVAVAAAYEKRIEGGASTPQSEESEKFEKVTRVVVFGDADWILNQRLDAVANRDLLLNALNWAAGEEGGISLRPKRLRVSFAPIPVETFKLLIASSLLVPELLLLLGLWVWWRRKNVAGQSSGSPA